MKKTLAILAATCWLIDSTHAQTTATTGMAGTSAIVGYQIGNQGAHSRVWQKIVRTTDAQGHVTLQTNQAYIELASGLNHMVNGQWMASREEIDILSNGTAAATNGQHQAYFPGDIYQGQIELVTPDGIQLFSRPLGLSYFDGTNSVLIAELTNSIGVLSGSNQVIYPNAFTDFAADLRYTYTKMGFEQDIILQEQPPTPESFGLNPATTRLEVLTEFFSPSQPTIQSTAVSAPGGLSLTDESLAFGAMQMLPGRAFLLGGNAKDVGVRVDKQWLQLNGRQFLVEEVPVEAIAGKLTGLPLPAVQAGAGTMTHTVSKHLVLPPQRLATTTTQPVLLAKASAPTQGLVLDYYTVNDTFANFTFQADTTYYIGPALLEGTNVFEGGAVLKFDDWHDDTKLMLNAIGGINLWTFKAGPYCPVIFTSMEDNSVGEVIAIDSNWGIPYVCSTYLTTYCDNVAYNPIQNARFCYASTAIHQENGVSPSPMVNCQFVNCRVAILDEESAPVQTPVQKLYNVLLSGCSIGVQNTMHLNLIVDGENLTVDQVNTLLSAGASLSGNFTNCILSSVTQLTDNPSYTTLSGVNNGFYNCTELGTGAVTNTFNPFQSMGAGNYYLTNGCAFTNAGTATIDPTLLAALRQKTTYPPLPLTNQPISTNITLSPQVQRDTDTLDLGYHYDPIDYLVDSNFITSATLTVTNGAVIASYNEPGIQLCDGAAVVSIGSPLYPNWFIRYNSVQEQSIFLGGTNMAAGLTVNASPYGSVGPTGQYRFSKFACPAGGGALFNDTGTNAYNSLQIRDCELYSGVSCFNGNTNTVTVLLNNLFDRSAFTATNFVSTSLSLSNNLIFGTTVLLGNQATPNTWQAFNNAFDSCIITTNQTLGTLTNGYNAYLNCTNRLNPTNAFDIVTNGSLAYQTGPLGTFYQPTNSPLINKGSTNANLLGFYHYTVLTNLVNGQEIKETNSIVDIGYHYVAMDANGNPIDTDGDGIPDYIADANGNGLVDAGETPWLPTVTIQATTPTASKAGPVTGQFTVYRTGSTTAALTVNVQVDASSTAVAGIDYQPISSTVTIPANRSSATVTVTPILNGATVSQTVVLDVQNNSANYWGGTSPNTATVTIQPAPTVTIQATTPTASKAGPVTGQFTVYRTGSTTAALTVNVQVDASSTAVAGTDYQPISSTVTIPANQSSATVTVTPILNGATVSQTVVLDVQNNSANYWGGTSPNTATVTIQPAPTVTIQATTPTASKAGPVTGQFTVYRTGSTTAALTVNVQVDASSTAVAGTDYQPISSTVTIPANQSSATVTVTPILNGATVSQTVVLDVQNNSANYWGGTSPNTATVTIQPAPTVTIQATTPTASKAGPVTGQFTVYRTGSTTAALTVNVQVDASSTAVAGIDYQPISSTVTIPANQSSATVTVTPILNGATVSQTVVLDVQNNSANYWGGTSPNTATVTIQPAPTVTIQATTPTASKAGPVTGQFTVYRTGSTTAALTVNVQVDASSTAVAGTDYQPISSTVTIPANQSSATVTVTPILNGATVSQTVVLDVQNNSANYWGGTSPNTATVTIQPAPTVTIQATTPTASEFGPISGTFTVTRNSIGLSQPLVVSYTPSGTAVNGTSYQSLSSPATIPANQSSATITLTPMDDGTVIWTETAILTLQTSPNYYVITPLPSATVNITDEYGDTDGDGLADALEAAFGCSPQTPNSGWKTDSDGDGLPDTYQTMVGPADNPAPGLPSYNKCPVP